jgi:hypothetical protein
MSAKLGLATVDLGCPQLSMHSIREMCCATSVSHATTLFQVSKLIISIIAHKSLLVIYYMRILRPSCNFERFIYNRSSDVRCCGYVF